jgi:DNA-binding PadR family transcriptional regulator
MGLPPRGGDGGAYCVSMSVRYGLLSLLRPGPRYGYQLRAEFEETTAGVWPLNIGQVYSTLGRLTRDGLTEPLAAGENGQQPFALTEAGHAEVESWFHTPQPASERPRDELSIKIALAMSTPGIDARAVIQRQRTTTMRSLQEHTRLLAHDADAGDLAWRLLLERLIADLDAQLRWLDRCDELITADEIRPAARKPSRAEEQHAERAR